jgi:hypothetical protein
VPLIGVNAVRLVCLIGARRSLRLKKTVDFLIELCVIDTTFFEQCNFLSTQWEIFRGGETIPSNKHLSVTINAKNVLLLNRNTRNILGNPEAVLLMYDRLKRMIGVAATHAGDADGFTVKLIGLQNYVIHTAPFCRHHGIVI